MSYNEELDPNSNFDSEGWTPEAFEPYEYSLEDKRLANKLLSGQLKAEEEEESAVHRLAQISAETGSIPARAVLAQFGGIKLSEVWLYKGAVSTKVVEFADFEAHDEVLRRSRLAKREGSIAVCVALSGVIGIYPPEDGDSLPCLEMASLDPYHDSKHDFRTSLETNMIGAIGNGG